MKKAKKKKATKAVVKKHKKAASVKKSKSIKVVKKAVKKAPKKTARPLTKANKKIKPLKKIAKAPKKLIKKTIKVSKPVKTKKTVKAVKPEKPMRVEAVEPAKIPFDPINYKPTINKSSMNEPVVKRAQQKNTTDTSGRSRYTDSELKEFKEIILNKLEDARKELTNLQAAAMNSNEHGTDDTASTFKMLEDGSDTLAKEEAGQLAARQRKFIEQLENALVRIENKSYGICRVTGKLIPKERLRAVPHTTQSIEAKMQQYRME
ncbi:MAG: TraR/DksA family transcriptional regulator [Bacteroidia bacterium]